jgi:hypothetical protein
MVGIVLNITIQLHDLSDLRLWLELLITIPLILIFFLAFGNFISRIRKNVWASNTEAVEAYWLKTQTKCRYSQKIPFKVGVFLFLPIVFSFIVLGLLPVIFNQFDMRFSHNLILLQIIFLWKLIPSGYWYRTKRYYWLAGGTYLLSLIVGILPETDKHTEIIVWSYSFAVMMLIMGAAVFIHFLKKMGLIGEKDEN